MFRIKDEVLDFIIKSYEDKSLKVGVSISKIDSLGHGVDGTSWSFSFDSDIYLIIDNKDVSMNYNIFPSIINIDKDDFDFCEEKNEDITSLIIESYLKEIDKRISLLVKREKEKKVLDFKNITMTHEGENIKIITRTVIE